MCLRISAGAVHLHLQCSPVVEEAHQPLTFLLGGTVKLVHIAAPMINQAEIYHQFSKSPLSGQAIQCSFQCVYNSPRF